MSTDLNADKPCQACPMVSYYCFDLMAAVQILVQAVGRARGVIDSGRPMKILKKLRRRIMQQDSVSHANVQGGDVLGDFKEQFGKSRIETLPA